MLTQRKETAPDDGNTVVSVGDADSKALQKLTRPTAQQRKGHQHGTFGENISVINYITLGTNDLDRAAKFYDQLLALVGAKRAMANERSVGWIGPKGAPMLMIMKPFDGKPATSGNGVMMALTADSPEQVAALHAKAIELGGADEGAPGPRGDAFHCGYFRDLDGNKWNAFYLKR